jgi:acetyltransferase, GNAT family
MGRFSKKYSPFFIKRRNRKYQGICPHALKKVSHLVIIENIDKTPIAFMGIEGNKLEMLFIKNSERKKGFGKKLLTYGITHYGVNELVVNEENPTAIKFYEHMGFKTYQRKELDEQNNPYPILYMRLEIEKLKK